MSPPKVVIVDYGVGNLLSVSRAFEHCGAEAVLSNDPDAIRKAERLILPGVGAFGDCMSALSQSKLTDPVLDFIATQRPLFGICVGMQILLDVSEEFGEFPGLGIIPGRVKAIPGTTTQGEPHKIPHIGWSNLETPREANADRWQNTIMADLTPGEAVYFVHSFTGHPVDTAHRLADTYYGGNRIAAAVARDNVVGVQFHPEKSGTVGLKIIQRFLQI